jgi:hypothetical protein
VQGVAVLGEDHERRPVGGVLNPLPGILRARARFQANGEPLVAGAGIDDQ